MVYGSKALQAKKHEKREKRPSLKSPRSLLFGEYLDISLLPLACWLTSQRMDPR